MSLYESLDVEILKREKYLLLLLRKDRIEWDPYVIDEFFRIG